MFQLLGLILTFPIGVSMVDASTNVIYAAIAANDCGECGFSDLGKLMLAGVVLATVLGISISLWYWRRKEKRTSTPEFLSIRASTRNK